MEADETGSRFTFTFDVRGVLQGFSPFLNRRVSRCCNSNFVTTYKPRCNSSFFCEHRVGSVLLSPVGARGLLPDRTEGLRGGSHGGLRFYFGFELFAVAHPKTPCRVREEGEGGVEQVGGHSHLSSSCYVDWLHALNPARVNK